MFDNPLSNVPYIPIDQKAVPYSFNIKLAGKTFTFAFAYNERGGFYTCDLYKGKTALVYGEILRYARPLFGTIKTNLFPQVDILPLCLSDKRVHAITRENFGNQVKLYLRETSA